MPKALVIEDDEDTRANLVDLLELDQFEVLTASTGAEAIAQLKKGPQIAILDRKLPDGVAEDLLPDLRRHASSTDFIVVTGFANLESAVAAMRAGATDYLLKPIRPDEFRQRIQNTLKRQELQESFRRQQEFAEQILKTAEAIILVLDLQGRIKQFNPYLEQLSGWSLDEVHDKDWFNFFIPEEERGRVRQIFLETASGIHSHGIVNPILTRDGAQRTIRWSNNTLKDTNGETYAVLAIGLDVTDLAETQDRALRAERLATIGEMMAAMAHESRNALQRIQASTDLLGLEVEGNEQAEKDLVKIRRAAKDLNILLEEIRAFAAPICLRKEQASIVEIVQQAWANIEQSTSKATLHIASELSRAEASVDIVRVEQVFRNLFENSLAATQGQAEIHVEAQATSQQLESVQGTSGASTNGTTVAPLCLSVRDDGPGLNTEQERKIFQAFYTTKDTGTGLGMAIVQRIVEAHGGTIAVDTQYDGGAKFNIRLPSC